jgi:hypothetical protein
MRRTKTTLHRRHRHFLLHIAEIERFLLCTPPSHHWAQPKCLHGLAQARQQRTGEPPFSDPYERHRHPMPSHGHVALANGRTPSHQTGPTRQWHSTISFLALFSAGPIHKDQRGKRGQSTDRCMGAQDSAQSASQLTGPACQPARKLLSAHEKRT